MSNPPMKDYVESRISSVNARIDEMEDSSGGLTRVILTSSGTFVAPDNISAKVTCIGGGGAGGNGSYGSGNNGVAAGGAGGDTSFGSFVTSSGGSGAGGAGGGGTAISTSAGGGGGGAGHVACVIVSLTKNQSISYVIGAGGIAGKITVDPPRVTNAAFRNGRDGESSSFFEGGHGNYTGIGGDGGKNGGAAGKNSSYDSYAGGNGGLTGYNYGNGGGGGSSTPGKVGPGVTAPSAASPYKGSNGGPGAIIIEYIKT